MEETLRRYFSTTGCGLTLDFARDTPEDAAAGVRGAPMSNLELELRWFDAEDLADSRALRDFFAGERAPSLRASCRLGSLTCRTHAEKRPPLASKSTRFPSIDL